MRRNQMTPAAPPDLAAPDQQQGHQAEVVGVDGCKASWVGVVLHGDGFSRAVVAARFGDLLSAVPTATVVAVDIPIGPPATARRADVEARRVVGARSSSVFPTPPRAVVEAATYEEANRQARALIGRGIQDERRLSRVAQPSRRRSHPPWPPVRWH